MIEIMNSDISGNYQLAGNSNDEAKLTGVPLTIANNKVIKTIATGSIFLNVETRKVKFYDRESNEWK